MATGIVQSIDPTLSPSIPSVTGVVQIPETGEIFQFFDNNFPNTGLAVNDPCTFDLSTDAPPVASNLQPVKVVTPPPITGPYTGDVTANVGEVWSITGATAVVTGNIIINGGTVFISDKAQVNGNVTNSNDGLLVIRKNGGVKGNVTINTSSSLKVVNGGKVTGSIMINQAGRMILGNDNGGAIIYGAITISKIRDVIITSTTKMNC